MIVNEKLCPLKANSKSGIRVLDVECTPLCAWYVNGDCIIVTVTKQIAKGMVNVD